ncbi:transcriptional regulator family: C2H2 zinc finger [Penicillium brevicompactum]|uniref:transcriptional regulator family: C2H2 zinc finger n=1 Tax=Penicillium brevicompactum TaxID=5074 RepID=UPI00254067A8|nr:transcriptional regulator family: C2H2 zinc finger [Penicillium brevicompactum]KAJ5347026.1 transcriptional regulator family: C2H2 zinc finger [Penicillium brevicompactum]
MPMLTAEFLPSETDTRVGCSPSLPVPPYEPTQHFENSYLSINPLSQEGSYVDGAILAPCMQDSSAPQTQHSGSVLSTEPTGVTKDMTFNGTHVGLGVSQVGSLDPTSTVSPDPFLSLELGHQSAQMNKESRMSQRNAPLGDLALATGCSSVCQNSFLPMNFNTLKLPQIEPTSNTDTAVTQIEITNDMSSSYYDWKIPESYNGTIIPPSLAQYNSTADMTAYSFIPLPICSPLDFPYGEFSSSSAFPYESSADLELSNNSYDLNSTGDPSYTLPTDATPSNDLGVLQQTITGPLLIQDQTTYEKSMSSPGNGSLCAPNTLECSCNCCVDDLKTYSSGDARKSDAYIHTLRESDLISSNDTLCNDQTGPYKCDFTSPVTGEACSTIFSRVYDCSRHKDTIPLDSEKEFKCHMCSKKAYKSKSGLSKHIRKMHNEQPIINKKHGGLGLVV